MKPKTLMKISIIPFVLSFLCVIISINDNDRTFTSYAADGTPFVEHVTPDSSGYIVAAIFACLGLILLFVGYTNDNILKNK